MISYITELNKDTFEEYITNKKNVLLMVKAPWCQSCKSMMPTIEILSNEMYNEMNFAIIDADENQSFVMDMGVRNLPTTILFKDGIEKNRFMGPKSKSGIINFINEI